MSQQTPILSRNEALTQLSTWLAALNFSPDLKVHVSSDVWEHGQQLAVRASEQIAEDPRTEAFIEHQTSDFWKLVQSYETPVEWTVSRIRHLHQAVVQGQFAELEARARQDFESARLSDVWSQEKTHSTAVNLTQSVTAETDAFTVHLVAKIYVDTCFQRLETVSSVLRAFFWQARMSLCAQMGYLSTQILKNTSTVAEAFLVNALNLVSEAAWSSGGLTRARAERLPWTPSGESWVVKDFELRSTTSFSSKWFPLDTLFWAESSTLYALRHPALPSSFRGVRLSKEGDLSPIFEAHQHAAETDLHGLICARQLSEPTSVVVDDLPAHVQQRLEEGYDALAKTAVLESQHLNLTSWVEKQAPVAHVLATLKRLPTRLSIWIHSTSDALTRPERNTLWGHHLVLLQRTLKAHAP